MQNLKYVPEKDQHTKMEHSIPHGQYNRKLFRALLLFRRLTLKLQVQISTTESNKQPPKVFYKKKVVLQILQNLQENTVLETLFLIKKT